VWGIAVKKVPVLIVGGGGAGLACSSYLSLMGIETLLVSALPTTSLLPKAHELNQRAMEVLSDLGLREAVEEIGTPPDNMRTSSIEIGFAGHPSAGQTLWKLECWGAAGQDPEWLLASPYPHCNLPQMHLEPLMKKRAEELAPESVLFGHKLIDLVQDDDGVTSTIENLATGETYQVRSDYVIAADGGRTVGKIVGIELEGVQNAAQEVSVHFSADLSGFGGNEDTLIRWIMLPHDDSAMCVLVPMGPKNWGTKSEEWVYHSNYEIGDPRVDDEEAIISDMRERLGIGDHPLQIHLVSRWFLGGVLADKFSVGRVFAVGDAAHRHPPTGGLGLNSALHDAQNLCWKLAFVVRGLAEPTLLQTYEPERRPVDARNVQRAVENSFQWIVSVMELGLGASDESTEEKWRRMERILSSDPAHREERAKVITAIQAHSMEFHEHAVEFGYEHASSAVIADGTESSADPDFHRFTPEARPGHPLPHAWLRDVYSQELSTLDLVDTSSFLLIAGEDADSWLEAGRALEAEGLPIRSVSIGHLKGEYFDHRVRWQHVRGHGPEGAVLVRPDRCIAFRAHHAVDDAQSTLRSVLNNVLGR